MHIVGANPIFPSGLMLGAPITNSCRRRRRRRRRKFQNIHIEYINV